MNTNAVNNKKHSSTRYHISTAPNINNSFLPPNILMLANFLLLMLHYLSGIIIIMGQNDVGDNDNHSVWQNAIFYKEINHHSFSFLNYHSLKNDIISM